MKKEDLFDLMPPGRRRLAEAMVGPLKTALKKGRFGACVDCGMDLRGVAVHPEEECVVHSVLES